jgi:hypothetical protein
MMVTMMTYRAIACRRIICTVIVLNFILQIRAFVIHDHQKVTTISAKSSALYGTLYWTGDAKASITIDHHETILSQKRQQNTTAIQQQNLDHLSVQDWLNDPMASNVALLGTPDVEPYKSDRNKFQCRQPLIDFLGFALQPVFVNQIDRSSGRGRVTVSIIDAKTEVITNGSKRAEIANTAIQRVMKDSKFHGRSVIKATSSGERPVLSIDLSLTLRVELPPLLIVPPGFNTIGSSIIEKTSQSRSKQLLQELKRNYVEWVMENVDETTINI